MEMFAEEQESVDNPTSNSLSTVRFLYVYLIIEGKIMRKASITCSYTL